MSSVNVWNPNMYDEKFNFVSNYGKGVIDLLNPRNGERILDWGCGTGDLSYEIAQLGAFVTGMDASSEMITKAREKYPSITFTVGNGETFRTTETYDAVFSNAALHWMKDAVKVVESIQCALHPGGRLVAEFGGKGNIQTVIRGISEVLHEDYGIDVESRNPWYFPSIGEYSTLLEKHGFEVTYANHYNRPTKLPDGDNGLYRFLDTFGDDFFPEFSDEEKVDIYAKIKTKTQSQLFKNGIWEADYRRIQILAIKKE
ncbi:class I SAM-dependent methyltransferase [Bacillus timonensis]|uniref:class I SAM-dependent methyltransferase n=1 Tax=Bacillus timonensis TaxID=1033734 RepID=UPI0002883F69|nr:class I SAM-dependent methyltransferase [Bacillus timonensis]